MLDLLATAVERLAVACHIADYTETLRMPLTAVVCTVRLILDERTQHLDRSWWLGGQRHRLGLPVHLMEPLDRRNLIMLLLQQHAPVAQDRVQQAVCSPPTSVIACVMPFKYEVRICGHN